MDLREILNNKKDQNYSWIALNLRNTLKYFAHGIIFSIILAISGIVWVFLLVALVVVGLIIGLIIGFGLFILILGSVNAFVTALLWFPVKTSFWSLVFHGLALFIVLLPIDIIILAIFNYAFPEITTVIVIRIILAFLYGFIGKKVAGFWEETALESAPENIEA